MARKEKQYHFIYKTTNQLNGKYYYGMHSTDDLNDGYMGSGKRLRYSINKYGKENHMREIIEYLPNRKSLAEREREIINLNEIAKKDCLNLMIGGKGGFISDEQQKHRSSCANKKLHEKRKNDLAFDKRYRSKLSESTTKCIKEGKIKTWGETSSFKGKKHTAETKKLISDKMKISQKKEKNSQYNTHWVTNGVINKKIKNCDMIPINWKLGRTLKY